MCPREQFCNEKGATYFAHPILHCRLSLVKEQTNGARLSTTDGCKIQDADYRICCETTMDTTHTLIQKTNMFSVYVVRIQKCFGHTVSQFCATPELPSKWQYLNQLKSLPNFIPTLSRFQIRKSWLFLHCKNIIVENIPLEGMLVIRPVSNMTLQVFLWIFVANQI